MPTVVLTIAGSDSGAGAGIQADLKSISANGGYGVSVLTSVTAQNTRAVTDAFDLPLALIEAQFRAVTEDFPIVAIKTGMLSDGERVGLVAGLLREAHLPNFVLDPVMISKSGYPLLKPEAISVLCRDLIPLADLVTPNVHEAAHLAEMDVHDRGDAETAGRRILELGAKAVLVKGGHLGRDAATDVLVTRENVQAFPGQFLPARNTHGTGCTYSAAIATHLGAGRALRDAIGVSKTYVTEAIRNGLPLGQGTGPTDHFYFLRPGNDGASRGSVSGDVGATA